MHPSRNGVDGGRNTGRLSHARFIVTSMQPQQPEAFSAKPGPWVELALTLPVFLGYHLGVRGPMQELSRRRPDLEWRARPIGRRAQQQRFTR